MNESISRTECFGSKMLVVQARTIILKYIRNLDQVAAPQDLLAIIFVANQSITPFRH